MVEISRVVLNLVSLAINIGLIYLALRLMLIFKGGKMGKSWLYITVAVLALAIGSSIFSSYYILGLPRFVHPIGGIAQMIGGILLLIGLYMEYKSWRVP
ncbi:MAG: hypothetical protein ACE5L6_05780 [Candidatus Bathyarchaeia archaeon]